MMRLNFDIGSVGFAIPQSVIPGFRNFLLDLSTEQAPKFPLLTEFWESSFSCSLKWQTGYSTGMPAWHRGPARNTEPVHRHVPDADH